MKWLTLNLALLLIVVSGLSGCQQTGGMPIYPSVSDVWIDANDVAPFAGVLVQRQRYDDLVRAKGHVLRESP